MGGLLIIAILAVYVWVATKVLRRVKPMWGKTLLIAGFVLLPTADAVYGRIKLKQLCESEGGLRVYRTIQEVNGFFESLGPAERWIKEFGFAFSEGPGTIGDRSVHRLSMNSDGAVVLERNVPRKSIYLLRFIPGDLENIYRRNKYVVETHDGTEILGEEVDFSYSGGWVERSSYALYASRGTAGTCGLSIDVSGRKKELVLSTLRPFKK